MAYELVASVGILHPAPKRHFCYFSSEGRDSICISIIWPTRFAAEASYVSYESKSTSGKEYGVPDSSLYFIDAH